MDSLATEAPPDTKPPLKLPSSKEDWLVADSFFSENLVPSVHQATSAEEKNSILADGIYNYFATQYGVRQTIHRAFREQKKDTKHQKHGRALKRVTELKNKARREFRRFGHGLSTAVSSILVSSNPVLSTIKFFDSMQ